MSAKAIRPANRRRGLRSELTHPQIMTPVATAAQRLTTIREGRGAMEYCPDLDDRAGELIRKPLEVKHRLAGNPGGQIAVARRGRPALLWRTTASQTTQGRRTAPHRQPRRAKSLSTAGAARDR